MRLLVMVILVILVIGVVLVMMVLLWLLRRNFAIGVPPFIPAPLAVAQIAAESFAFSVAHRRS